MVRLLMVSTERKLIDIYKPKRVKSTTIASSKITRRLLVKNIVALEEKWLQDTIPAFYRSHQGRHWVKSLKQLSEVSLDVLQSLVSIQPIP